MYVTVTKGCKIFNFQPLVTVMIVKNRFHFGTGRRNLLYCECTKKRDARTSPQIARLRRWLLIKLL